MFPAWAFDVRVAIQDAIKKQQLKVTSEAAINRWLYDYIYKTLDKCFVVEMQNICNRIYEKRPSERIHFWRLEKP